MSVFDASPGDEVVVIDDFVACRVNERFSHDSAVPFAVGQKVNFLSFRPCENMPFNKSMVLLHFAHQGQEFAAVVHLFVTSDHWDRVVEQVVAMHQNQMQHRSARDRAKRAPQEYT